MSITHLVGFASVQPTSPKAQNIYKIQMNEWSTHGEPDPMLQCLIV